MRKRKKIISIVGARPQFIKYGPLGKKLKKAFNEKLVHTGQHYDRNMSDLLFKDLKIPIPDFNLNIGSHNHGKQTGLILDGIEKILLDFKPDYVIVFGDTNSTLAGALAASKLHIKVIHIEAGLRSFNKNMPEEINRILTDHCSDILCCPTKNAVNLLKKEGIVKGVHLTGDIMLDAFLSNIKLASKKSKILHELNMQDKKFYLTTIHRAENTDNHLNLKSIFSALNDLEENVIIPLHPRTKKVLDQIKIKVSSKIKIVEPLGYLDMLQLLENCELVLTDSGGLQKEAYFAKKRCVTLRNETEWVETVNVGWNKLVGTDKNRIIETVNKFKQSKKYQEFYGSGDSSEKIVDIIFND